MKMPKLSFLTMAFVLVLGCAGLELANSSHESPQSQRIIPGKSIGDIYIGMSQSEVLRSLGNPSKAIPPSYGIGGLRYDYDQSKLRFMIMFTPIPEAVVQSVDTSSNRFVTDEGIRVGSSGADLIRAYGSDYDRREMNGSVNVVYPRLGLGVWLTPGNVIRDIYIISPE